MDDRGGFVEHAAAEAKRAEGARKTYKLAFENEKPFDLMQAIKVAATEASDLDKGSFDKVMSAIKNMADIDRAGTPAGVLGTRIGRSQKVSQSEMRALDDAIGIAKRNGENNLARILTIFKKNALSAVEGENKAYRIARQKFADDSEVYDAFEWGSNALNDNAVVSVDAFRRMTHGEQQMAKYGLQEAMKKLWMRRGRTSGRHSNHETSGRAGCAW